MEILEKIIRKFRSRNFLVYFIVGVIATILSTFFMWLLVDIIGVWVVYANLFVTVAIFVAKYLMYDAGKMLREEDKK